jgi:transcriptional regulator with XRE-family HTH domain
MRIGHRVRGARKALGLKQQELADEVEVTPQHISRIELGQAAPSVQTLLKLGQRLGVTADYLLTGRETMLLDASGAIRAAPDISATAKRHLIGMLDELRRTNNARDPRMREI